MDSSRWPMQYNAASFYGPVGKVPSLLVNLPFPYPVYFGVHLVHSCQIHKKCADSLGEVFRTIARWHGYDDNLPPEDLKQVLSNMRADGSSCYDGTYALRNKTGGNSVSMHAYGCAIDFDAARNPRGKPGHFKPFDIVVTAFKSEGWIWGGDWHGATCDPMHFQAARVLTRV
jgi:hypothetical protein